MDRGARAIPSSFTPKRRLLWTRQTPLDNGELKLNWNEFFPSRKEKKIKGCGVISAPGTSCGKRIIFFFDSRAEPDRLSWDWWLNLSLIIYMRGEKRRQRMKIDLIPHLLPIATAAEAHGKGRSWRNLPWRSGKCGIAKAPTWQNGIIWKKNKTMMDLEHDATACRNIHFLFFSPMF